MFTLDIRRKCFANDLDEAYGDLEKEQTEYNVSLTQREYSIKRKNM